MPIIILMTVKKNTKKRNSYSGKLYIRRTSNPFSYSKSSNLFKCKCSKK